MKEEFKKSVKAAELEFKEEPMDENYKNPIVGIISRGRVNKMLKDMAKLKGKKILDIGCEAGHVSLRLTKRGADVFSFDIIKAALVKFRKKAQNNSKIFLAAAQKMPLKDNIFDYVVCTEVIEHMPKLDLCISEMKRVLKPNGRLFLTFPNEKLRKTLYPLAKLCG
ncbi:MAG: class I SAM-dependent methyltransferase, partial [Nanoarchaeota archaeon]|nr:class I SAM-dependent methyltransferase [Nanoarchaeota archaeon]